MKNRQKETFFDYPVFNNIKEVIYYSVEKYKTNTAFKLKEKAENEVKYIDITYEEFLTQVNNLGTGLYELGLEGKRVAILSKNRYEWALSYVSLLLGGIIAVPLDKALTDIEIENSLLRGKVDAIIYEEKYEQIIEKVKKEGKSTIKTYICMEKIEGKEYLKDIMQKGEEEIKKGNKTYLDKEIDENALATLVFTSGTTSKSKIVMLSQYNIARNISDMQLVEDFRSTDVNLAFLPYHHTFGSTGQLIMLSSGIATAFPDGLRYIAQNLKEYHITFFVGVPILIEKIYEKIEEQIAKQKKTTIIKIAKVFTNLLLKFGIDIRRKVYKQIIDGLGGLRFVISGAAGLDKRVEKGLNDLGILTVQGYGLTETAPVLCAENYKYRKYGSIGLPMPSVEMKISEPNEEGIGEIIAKAPNLMLGYYEDEEATKEAIKDGWFYTGDYGYVDKQGFFYITGRKKNTIVLKNGKKIFPEEIEENINKIDLVEDCFVFGMPKEDDLVLSVKIKYNEEVMKKKYPSLNMEELKKAIWDKVKEANKLVPKYKYIKNMILTNMDFSKTTTNKIKRHEELQKMHLN